MEWKLADAKNRFSEVVGRALLEGPQLIHRRKEAVVVVDRRRYEQLVGKRADFKEFLMAKKPSLQRLRIERDRSPMREVKL